MGNIITCILHIEDITLITGDVRISFESTEPESVMTVFRVDGVSQEGNETITLRLVTSPNITLPTGKSVFMRDRIDLTVMDSDGEQSVHPPVTHTMHERN